MPTVSSPLTIAYFTCRRDPKVEWFFRSLNRELKGDWTNVKILVIDYLFQYEPEARLEYYRASYKDIKSGNLMDEQVTVISPKPSHCQGKFKVSRNDYFAASNARNTAFIHCTTDYIVCIDDLTVVKEGWLDVVLWGLQNSFVILGSYAKVKQLECDMTGTYKYNQESLTAGLDSRFKNPVIQSNAPTKVAGSWLFGCSFGMPLKLALEVDGFDEACDGQGAEDYDFGIRIGRITTEIYYSRQMFTYEDDDLHFAPGNVKFIRTSKVLTADTLMKDKIGVSSDHAMLQNVMKTNSPKPFLPSNLREAKASLERGEVAAPDFTNARDWRDGMLWSEM
jgi:hypothetical protein